MNEKTTILDAAVREARCPRAISVHHGVVAATLALTLGLGSVTAFGLSSGTYAGADEVPLVETDDLGIKGAKGAAAGTSLATTGSDGAAARAADPSAEADDAAGDAPALVPAEGDEELTERTANDEAGIEDAQANRDDDGALEGQPAEGKGSDAGDPTTTEGNGGAVAGDDATANPSASPAAAEGGASSAGSATDHKEPQASTAINLSTSEGITGILRSIDAAHEQLSTLPADKLLSEAMSHEGAPYVYGGTTPSGFDCSGFVLYCFRTALGMDLPRTAAAQSSLGESVPMDSLEPGDLLFWGSGGGVYHVGIYVGDGSYIHAAGDGQGVCVDTMTYFTPSFAKRLV